MKTYVPRTMLQLTVQVVDYLLLIYCINPSVSTPFCDTQNQISCVKYTTLILIDSTIDILMAEAIVLPLARSILKAIASFTGELVKADVGDEFKAFKSVKKDLKAIAEDLESITAVLVDADAKQYSNAAMKIWLRDLRSVVYDIDDLLDEVSTDALQKTANRGHFLPRVSALGLLKLKDGSYFNKKFFIDLLSRSMLQDVEWKFNNTINAFKIHDILHDLAADILGEELAVVSRNKFSVLESSRYIAWESSGLLDEEFPQQFKAKKARAFVFRFQMRSLSESFLKGVISNMPCLRVLAVGSSQFERLPSSIGNLKHLRLLDLSKNGLIKSLPDTVCKLLNLECLLLDGCKQLEELPSEIYKLTNLRYFSLTICQRSLVGTNINQLPSLRHMWFDSCMSLESFWDNDDVGCLTSLRSLRIVNCPKLTSLPDSMKLLVELEELLIANCKELDLESGEGLSGLQSLHTLAIQRVPELSCLPNGICCSAASSLQYLYFSDCIGLKKLPEKLQSFVSLQGLVILNCRSLLSLPKGIQHLTSLQSVEIDSSPYLSRRFAEPTEHYLSLIQQVHVIWLDGSRLTLDQL